MIDFSAINQAAIPNMLSHLHHILPNGVLEGNEYCVGDLSGTSGKSLKISVQSGRWADFATGEKGGDLISLIAAVDGISQSKAAIKLAEISGRSDHISNFSTKATPATAPPAPPADPEKTSYVWDKATEDCPDNIKRYFASRAIKMEMVPPCFRWGSYPDKTTGEIQNMVVAAASKPGDEFVVGVQRLFINVETFKKEGAKMHGPCHGRGVWFDRKASKKRLLIGEGIETTLSAMQALGINGVAALSTSGMKGLEIPEETEIIYILVDSDPIRENSKTSMPGQRAAYALAKRFVERPGRQAFLMAPDDTCFTDTPEKLDFNDLLQADPTGDLILARYEKAVKIEDLEWSPPAEEQETAALPNDLVAEAAMFERFVFLASENKIIDTMGSDIKDSMMVERAFIVSQAGLYHNYIDENGKPKVMPLAKYWLQSDHKKVASSPRYAPGEKMLFEGRTGRVYYNTFRFPYQMVKDMPEAERCTRLASWHIIMDAVFHEHRDYIEDWFSFTIQYPEKRSGIMPVCISEVGLGKSLVMAIMSRVVGHQNFSNGKILDVTGLGRSGTQWGDWIFNKKLSCIEEIDPEGESSLAYKVLDALKDIITNETLSLNLKGGRNGTFPVYANVIGFSNHKNCVKIPFGDRRLFIVDSTNQQLLSKDIYSVLWEWIKDPENIIAVYQYLRDRTISAEFIPGQAKMTAAKKSMQEDGRNPMQIAFDFVKRNYPCDLLTTGELQLAVLQATQYLEGENIPQAYNGNFNADRQYNAIMKSSTTLIANGQRVRVKRKGGGEVRSNIRALRNGQDWASATSEQIQESMYVNIPMNWYRSEDDNPVPF